MQGLHFKMCLKVLTGANLLNKGNYMSWRILNFYINTWGPSMGRTSSYYIHYVSKALQRC